MLENLHNQTDDSDHKNIHSQVKTDGGTYVGNDVNTSGGDFAGRDKNVITKNIFITFSMANPALTVSIITAIIVFPLFLALSQSISNYIFPMYKPTNPRNGVSSSMQISEPPVSSPIIKPTLTPPDSILVATFHGAPAESSEPQRKIIRKINDQLEKLRESSLQALVDSTILTADQTEEAIDLGKRKRARLVIWGEDTSVEIRVNFADLRQKNAQLSLLPIVETDRTEKGRYREEYSTFITKDLPNHVTFIALYAIGRSLIDQKSNSRAIQLIQSATDTLNQGNSTDENLKENLRTAYFTLGWLYQSAAPYKLEPAIESYNRAIQIDPQNSAAYNNRGVAFFALGKYDDAMHDFNEAIQLTPDLATTYNNRGKVFSTRYEIDNALVDFTIAIQLDRTFTNAYINRATAYRMRGNFEAAQRDYSTALEIDSLNPYAEQGLCDVASVLASKSEVSGC